MDARTRLVALAFSAIIAFQVIIPLGALVFGEKPARFGWQMYSAGVSVPVVEVVMADGDVRRIDLTEVAADVRQDVDYREHLPAFLCETVPAATQVLLDGSVALVCDG